MLYPSPKWAPIPPAPAPHPQSSPCGSTPNPPCAIVDRLHAAALALCGNRADAEDLVQETYLTLLRRPRRLTGGSELAYLMTMLRNRYIDDRRSAARRQASPGLYEADDTPDPRAGMRPDRVAEDREVIGFVHALESPFREVVVAVDVLGLSYKEAATALDGPDRHRDVAAGPRPRPRDPRARAGRHGAQRLRVRPPAAPRPGTVGRGWRS